MSRKLTETSKFLSFVLRHQPEAIGLTLDREGWTEIAALIARANARGRRLSDDLIREVVATNEKKRFTISEDGLRIRAAQGHSAANVAISYEEMVPPEVLYHGTATRFLLSIRREGLKSGTRHYVHLSQDVKTATTVGSRYGVPAVLKIAAQRMREAGFKFFQADNGVWLTERVPKEFIEG